jgi:hypothetical protein
VRTDDAVAAGISVGWGCVVAVGAYAVVRAIQFFVYPAPNPVTLVWSAHAGFFWRCWTCAYAGGIAAFVAFVAGRGRSERVVRGLPQAVAIAAILLALQTAFFP